MPVLKIVNSLGFRRRPSALALSGRRAGTALPAEVVQLAIRPSVVT
jgi:hypothetical protein